MALPWTINGHSIHQSRFSFLFEFLIESRVSNSRGEVCLDQQNLKENNALNVCNYGCLEWRTLLFFQKRTSKSKIGHSMFTYQKDCLVTKKCNTKIHFLTLSKFKKLRKLCLLCALETRRRQWVRWVKTRMIMHCGWRQLGSKVSRQFCWKVEGTKMDSRYSNGFFMQLLVYILLWRYINVLAFYSKLTIYD